jgi:hypothetical protein
MIDISEEKRWVGIGVIPDFIKLEARSAWAAEMNIARPSCRRYRLTVGIIISKKSVLFFSRAWIRSWVRRGSTTLAFIAAKTARMASHPRSAVFATNRSLRVPGYHFFFTSLSLVFLNSKICVPEL